MRQVLRVQTSQEKKLKITIKINHCDSMCMACFIFMVSAHAVPNSLLHLVVTVKCSDVKLTCYVNKSRTLAAM